MKGLLNYCICIRGTIQSIQLRLSLPVSRKSSVQHNNFHSITTPLHSLLPLFQIVKPSLVDLLALTRRRSDRLAISLHVNTIKKQCSNNSSNDHDIAYIPLISVYAPVRDLIKLTQQELQQTLKRLCQARDHRTNSSEEAPEDTEDGAEQALEDGEDGAEDCGDGAEDAGDEVAD